ncbi:MAG: class II aldolase/adducin family protein [Fervidobacterium sp.]
MFSEKIAKEIIKYGKLISDAGFTKGTWGNISVREDKVVYITPSGHPYDILKPEDVVVVDLHGETLYGTLKPSSELPLHLEIYKNRDDINAIIHTHPIYATTISIVKNELPPIVEDAVMILGERILVSKYALPGSDELAKNAVKALGKNHCVFLSNHGLVCVGENLQEAFIATQVAEKTSQIYIEALKIGNVKELPSEHAKLLREKYLLSYRQIRVNK